MTDINRKKNIKPAEQIAAAVKYSEGNTRNAPILSAKGRGYLADQIIKIAQQDNIPIYSEPDLAVLLAALDVGIEIPPEMYDAMAQVMLYLYRVNERVKDKINKKLTQRESNGKSKKSTNNR